MEKATMHSLDMVNENIKKIGCLFPECITETVDENGNVKAAIDFEKLQENLSHATIGEGEERYQFTWPGKREAIHNANAPTNMTLRPCKAESVDFDNTENLYIEGDNLEVLKLLQENYLGKVKMIYIDPPYNTGNDFVYNDDFKEDTESFQSKSGMYDEDGNMLLQNFEKNTESNGRFHTDWLNMMYPRLKIARNLLSDDGVIFISIDDNEQENLKKICDEIFGEQNFLNNFVWLNKPEGRQISGVGAAGTHEYILLYSKNNTKQTVYNLSANWLQQIMPSSYNGINADIKTDAKGAYIITHELYNGNSKFNEETRPTLVFDIYYRETDGDIKIEAVSETHIHSGYVKIPPHPCNDGVHKYHAYRWSKEKILRESNDLEFIKKDNSFKIYSKRRDFDYTAVKDIITDIYTTNGNKNIRDLEIKGFDYPKSVELLIFLMKMVTTFYQDEEGESVKKVNNSIILDFFSGSATTAHAVMQLNAEDGGKRKFICVQLPEATAEDSEAYKAGYKNICEIGKERIRRAGNKIKEEFGEKAKDLDIGFRVLKLADSNMKDVYYSPAETDSADIFDVNNVKEDRTPLDLLFQVMPECNLPLSSKIEERTIEGKTVYFVNGNYLVACFDEGITEKLIKAVIDVPDSEKPYYFYMRNLGLESDKVLDNFEQLFVHYSPTTKRKVI
ncbi:site-specific DNA-methyltransferase [Hallerella succinigenes]|uniref:site-specific DNA-methyltransferase (adenine-specific) n=1 Tax=Hallerella succinigenes TaxID=1896222 RepID=A0A2M9A5U3_9BACT|nr:site-specific DNA-methyltransferase [Hallerella succinigenes]PJJ40997.1 adenine-specific DNA-methyltransferase [Hallerella succinigenes]